MAEINSKMIDGLEAPYRARGLPPVWRLSPLTPPATDRLVNPAQRPTMTRMLQSIASPVGFALVEEAGQPLAFALGVAEGGHLDLFDILVSPAACRRGLVTLTVVGTACRRNPKVRRLDPAPPRHS